MTKILVANHGEIACRILRTLRGRAIPPKAEALLDSIGEFRVPNFESGTNLELRTNLEPRTQNSS